MTIGLTWRRTARRIKRLKEGVLTISRDYSDRPTPDVLALSICYSNRVIRGLLEAFFSSTWSPKRHGCLLIPADHHPCRVPYLLDKWIIISESGPRPGRDIAELNEFPIYRIHSSDV